MNAQPLAGVMRWSVGLMLALGLHGAAAAFLLAHWHASSPAIASAPTILVDFVATPAAPAVMPRHMPPGPTQPQLEAQPAAAKPKPAPKAERKPEAKPAPKPVPAKSESKTEIKTPPMPLAFKRPIKAEIPAPLTKPVENKPVEKRFVAPPPAPQRTIDVLPPPRPLFARQERQTRQRLASRASAPPAAAHRAARAVARAPGASTRNPDAIPDWKSALVAQIERHKHYPQAALVRGQHGVARVAFTVDRHGGLHDVHIVESSGSALLDRDALAWLHRSAPLPPPPPQMRGARIRIVVPLRYDIH